MSKSGYLLATQLTATYICPDDMPVMCGARTAFANEQVMKTGLVVNLPCLDSAHVDVQRVFFLGKPHLTPETIV